MRKLFTIVLAVLLTANVFAQSPEKMSYQAVIRNSSDVLITNTQIGMEINIHQSSASGTVVYTETQTPTTNANGLVSIEIGGAAGFNTIDWAAGPYFIETKTDPTGGTSYTITGTSQLLSVPYALYAKIAENATNDMVNDADADSTNELQTLSITGDTLKISNGNNVILPAGGGNWTLNGANINNSNIGNVGIGDASVPNHTLVIGRMDTTTSLAIGHIGNFNEAKSGRLVFAEDLNYTASDCGLAFEMNGAQNNLYLYGGCPTPDTIARFNRSGFTNIKNLRLGTNITTNSINPLTVSGNSDFTGDMTITGNLTVTGNIAKGGGTFKIDHPLDPANKYLVHSFVESPEMMNVFSGNVTTDGNGFATVTMPSYFEAANKDFRYQLTVMGSFAQAIIKEKVSNNKFVIQTNNPNVEVSWQVTSVRADKYANENRVVPELEKEIKGTYIHPELYGASKENSENARKAKIALDAQVGKVGADQQ